MHLFRLSLQGILFTGASLYKCISLHALGMKLRLPLTSMLGVSDPSQCMQNQKVLSEHLQRALKYVVI